MKHEIAAVFVAMSIVFIGFVASGAPSLPITKTPVTPNPSYTGPTNDPHAVMGQWFQNVTNQAIEYRTHEFYDNIPGSGGGVMGSQAISGHVIDIVYDQPFLPPPRPIISFDVEVTIYNDANSININSWGNGTNNLQEGLITMEQYTNIFIATILTADFATAGSIPTAFSPPYADSTPYITAVNHDYAAWYGWTLDTIGSLYVPGWDFGSVDPGQAATRTLQFAISDGAGTAIQLKQSDDPPRYNAIVDSYNNGTDIFINRSDSLKISQWISDPAADDGSAYPTGAEGDLSNVSVFHNTLSDQTQTIHLRSLAQQSSPATDFLNSTGSSGITWQILQCCTNLVSTNWINIATNMAWPEPQTNHWTNTTISGSVNFFRIIQP